MPPNLYRCDTLINFWLLADIQLPVGTRRWSRDLNAMTDVRSPEWYSGRIVLCGDAAAAFLPTAGVGASNAMRSAAALADELSKTDTERVPLALEMYVKGCRKIVEKNQDDSRKTARLVFVESKTVGWGRDQLIKHYPAKRMLKQIVKSMRQPFPLS